MPEGETATADAEQFELRSVAQARRHVAENALRAGPVGMVGLELEGHLIDREDLARRVSWPEIERLRELVPPLPAGSLLSVEPGGQLELSTQPADGIAGAVRALLADQQVLAAALAAEGYGLAYLGLDPVRQPERVNPSQRYIVMEDYFDRVGCGPAGRLLMSSSAGLQLNLEAGSAGEWISRLNRIHRLAPVLAAMSACSGWAAKGAASLRQRAWLSLDPARTAPVRVGDDPADDWAEYALAAPLMLIRTADGGFVEAPPTCTLRDWLERPEALGRRPTTTDVDYHLTTLFPVVRPRGFLELRFLDAAPRRFWPGLAAIVAALIDHPDAADRVDAMSAATHPDWGRAANQGLHDPELRELARAYVAIAVDHCPDELYDEATAYAEIVSAGRPPGELLLDEAGGDGWRLLEEALDA